MKQCPSAKNVNRYNSKVLGMQNYYSIASHVNLDFAKIAFHVNKNLYNRLRSQSSSTGYKSETFKKFYGGYNLKTMFIHGIALYPIAGVKKKTPINFTQEICNYTQEGRKFIHSKLKNIDMNIVKYLMNNPTKHGSIEYNDNRISLYVGQKGLCAVTGIPLEIGNMECHHKKPRKDGGTDKYSNLVLVSKNVHKLIHATTEETIEEYSNKLKLDDKQKDKINKLRKLVGNIEI